MKLKVNKVLLTLFGLTSPEDNLSLIST